MAEPARREKIRRRALYADFDAEFETLTGILKSVEISKDDVTSVEASLAELKDTFDKICEVNDDVETKLIETDSYDEEMVSIRTRRSRDRKRLMIVWTFVDQNRENNGNSSTKPAPTTKTAQLPKLRLPIFDWAYTKWSAF